MDGIPWYCGWWRNPFAPRNETMVDTIRFVGYYVWESKHSNNSERWCLRGCRNHRQHVCVCVSLLGIPNGSLAQNPVLKWSQSQNHASRIKKADIRHYFWLGLALTNLHQSPGFEQVAQILSGLFEGKRETHQMRMFSINSRNLR